MTVQRDEERVPVRSFGEALRSARTRACVTTFALASELGLTARDVIEVEADRSGPWGESMVRRAARVVSGDVDVLLAWATSDRENALARHTLEQASRAEHEARRLLDRRAEAHEAGMIVGKRWIKIATGGYGPWLFTPSLAATPLESLADDVGEAATQPVQPIHWVLEGEDEQGLRACVWGTVGDLADVRLDQALARLGPGARLTRLPRGKESYVVQATILTQEDIDQAGEFDGW